MEGTPEAQILSTPKLALTPQLRQIQRWLSEEAASDHQRLGFFHNPDQLRHIRIQQAALAIPSWDWMRLAHHLDDVSAQRLIAICNINEPHLKTPAYKHRHYFSFFKPSCSTLQNKIVLQWHCLYIMYLERYCITLRIMQGGLEEQEARDLLTRAVAKQYEVAHDYPRAYTYFIDAVLKKPVNAAIAAYFEHGHTVGINDCMIRRFHWLNDYSVGKQGSLYDPSTPYLLKQSTLQKRWKAALAQPLYASKTVFAQKREKQGLYNTFMAYACFLREQQRAFQALDKKDKTQEATLRKISQQKAALVTSYVTLMLVMRIDFSNRTETPADVRRSLGFFAPAGTVNIPGVNAHVYHFLQG